MRRKRQRFSARSAQTSTPPLTSPPCSRTVPWSHRPPSLTNIPQLDWDISLAEPPDNAYSQEVEMETEPEPTNHTQESVETEPEPPDVQNDSTPSTQDPSTKDKKFIPPDWEEYQCHHCFIKWNRTLRIADRFFFRCRNTEDCCDSSFCCFYCHEKWSNSHCAWKYRNFKE